jgi:charged multivesicular body protein 7
MSPTDLKVLLTHLSRDRSALSYSPSTDTIKLKAPSESQPSPITNEDVSIAKLRTLISSLEPQIERLTHRVSELNMKSREAVTNKQLTTAKSLLRSKKLADQQLQQRSATLASLEEVYAKIEQAADQVEIVHVMNASSKTLQSLNKQTGGVERVQDVMDGLKEEMTTTEEIGSAINEVGVGEIDEGEVEDELEALEKVEREKVEEAERKERERVEEAERKEKEKREAEEAEKTRAKLDELDRIVDAGTPPVSNEAQVTNKEGESESTVPQEQVAT